MFGLFKSASFSDPLLGELSRARGFWRGTLQLGSKSVPVALAGSRAAPDADAIAAARQVHAQLQSWHPAIETALFGHYEPYSEAVAEGKGPETSEHFPSITSPAGVWPHVSLEFVSISPLSGTLITELGYAAAWDEEHMLGARFNAGKLVELCGSVLPP
jgi:hypothetical protein